MIVRFSPCFATLVTGESFPSLLEALALRADSLEFDAISLWPALWMVGLPEWPNQGEVSDSTICSHRKFPARLKLERKLNGFYSCSP